MSYHQFYKEVETTALKLFPSLSGVEVAWEHLISPLELKLPTSILASARDAIEAFYRVSRRPAYAAALPFNSVGSHKTNHNSALMAYDFHTTEDGQCFLVEINTNGAGYLLSSLMQLARMGQKPESHAPIKDLFESFANELKLSGVHTAASPRVAICDEGVIEQRMYPEFLMYRDFFRSYGWSAEIIEASEFTDADLVYNRTTDFYLDQNSSASIRLAHLSGRSCVTPNPHEYWLLADKERLVQFGLDSFWTAIGGSGAERGAIEKVLIPTFEKNHFASLDDIWEQRKTLFFKPKRSHGGKSVYRGESVSRKVFERLMADDILIQKFQPAQKFPVDDERSVLNNWKFDLRFYVYQDRIQMCVARAYQGQVTNFASPLGGFTYVQF